VFPVPSWNSSLCHVLTGTLLLLTSQKTSHMSVTKLIELIFADAVSVYCEKSKHTVWCVPGGGGG
jgi:hypothetical protein